MGQMFRWVEKAKQKPEKPKESDKLEELKS